MVASGEAALRWSGVGVPNATPIEGKTKAKLGRRLLQDIPGAVVLDLADVKTATGGTRDVLVVSKDAMLPGYAYTFTLEATVEGKVFGLSADMDVTPPPDGTNSIPASRPPSTRRVASSPAAAP